MPLSQKKDGIVVSIWLEPDFDTITEDSSDEGCLVQVGNGIELEAVDLQFEPYGWCPCGVTWDSSRTVVVIKLQRTSALIVWWEI